MKKKIPKQLASLVKSNYSKNSGKFNLKYSSAIEKEYDEVCGYGGECDHEYNRCMDIVNARVTGINVETLAEECLLNKDVPSMVRYAVYRIISQSRLADKDNWTVEVCGGYYGDEIDGCSFYDSQEVDRVEEALSRITDACTEKQLLDIALEFEYGYVLDSLQGKSATIDCVNPDNIMPNARNHYNRLDRDRVSEYGNKYLEKSWDKKPTTFQKLPVCVVLKEGRKYLLIDGCHRYTAYVKSVGKDMNVVVVE